MACCKEVRYTPERDAISAGSIVCHVEVWLQFSFRRLLTTLTTRLDKTYVSGGKAVISTEMISWILNKSSPVVVHDTSVLFVA